MTTTAFGLALQTRDDRSRRSLAVADAMESGRKTPAVGGDKWKKDPNNPERQDKQGSFWGRAEPKSGNRQLADRNATSKPHKQQHKPGERGRADA